MTDASNVNRNEDQVAKKLGVGKRFQVNGFTPRRPVALFNSLSGCVVEVVESDSMPKWAKPGNGALWVDITKVTGATLGNVTGLGHTKTRATRSKKWQNQLVHMMDTNDDGNVDPTELMEFLKDADDLKKDGVVQKVIQDNDDGENKTTAQLLKELKPSMPRILAALLAEKADDGDVHDGDTEFEGSTAFTKHMQLRDGWNDPHGIKVRPRKGLAAMECLVANDPTGLASKLGAALMLGVTSQLKAVGYEEGKNLRGYGYDWRMPCTKMEERDSYFSKTMEDMEDLVKTNNGEKVVVVTHSLGGVHATYFFHWVAHSEHGISKGGANWLKNHIHAFCPIAAPSLGTPYGSASYLSGDEGQGLAPMVFSFADRHLVVRSWGMFGMIFPSGRHLMLQPTHSVHWVRREAVLNVHVLSVAMTPELQQTLAFYIKLGLTAPVSHNTHNLNTSSLPILTEAAVDQRFQFAWTSTPNEVETVKLAVSFMHDIIGPIDRELAKGKLELGSANIKVLEGVDEGKTLEGLTPNKWCRYEINLKSDKGSIMVTMRMQFVPHSDTEQSNDFSRPVEEDEGAWRCGGPADKCSTPEKQARLIEAIGKGEGSEWRPEVKKNPLKEHADATYAPMSIDQMMVYDKMRSEYKWWKECYADDKIWRAYSTEAPQGISRIRPIYGIDVPTLVGNVYRRQTKRFIRFQPSTTMKLDKHCEVKHPGYKVKGGIVEEVPKHTPQADDPTMPLESMTFNTRASGDGTVAYWSLKWPVTWRSSDVEVEAVEVGGADHRSILDKPECSMAILSECCSHPIKYLEILLDGLIITGLDDRGCTGGCMAAFTCVSTMGVVNDNVCLRMKWRNVEFSTENTSEDACRPDRTKKLWKRCRFVLGVTKQDLDVDRALEVSVRKTNGTLREGTKSMKMSIGKLMNESTENSVVSFDDNRSVILNWSCRSVLADSYGLPKC